MTNDNIEVWGLCAPVLAMCGIALLLAWSHLYQALFKNRPSPRRFGIFVPSAALGFAFLTLPVIYRPSLALLVKAQIQQQEDADQDDNGDPDIPVRHLRRQLRRIRRGQLVDRLIIRRE